MALDAPLLLTTSSIRLTLKQESSTADVVHSALQPGDSADRHAASYSVEEVARNRLGRSENDYK